MRLFCCFIFFLLFSASNVASQDDSRLRLSDGTLGRKADLRSISDNWEFEFQINGKTESISADQFVKWGNRAPMPRGPYVHLVGGSQILLDSSRKIVMLANGQLQLESTIWQPGRIPQSQIRAIVFSRRQALPNPLLIHTESRADGLDEVVLNSGRRQTGRVVQIDLEKVVMRNGGRTATIPRNQVAYVQFANRMNNRNVADQTSALISLRDGSELSSTSVMLDDERLTVHLTGGVVLKSKRGAALIACELVRSVRLLHRSIRYLSDIQPFSYKHVPYLSLSWPYGLDENLFAAPLRSQGTPFSKGISMHSLSRLAFRLPVGFERFESELALDDSAEQGGSVVFRVYLESQGRWNEMFQSGKVLFGSPKVDCKVELGQATGIALVVDGASDTDYMDHANWLDARIVKVIGRN